ncbi:hypothetical protein TSAR_002806 [Trichomalopsis sarcophagae]|uniref:Uncharacterized protein n=1 Tax=Trichomalopsis sarcophagae TaxID=543379 RepID=A0A232F6Z1_9HYME|nr:hypothetical protein TSAR_002806 [Trichomalopsis sarcophagae]
MLHSEPDGGRILSVMKEPLDTGISAIMLSKFTPYANEFDIIIQRSLESGIPIFWMSNAIRIYGLTRRGENESRVYLQGLREEKPFTFKESIKEMPLAKKN